MRKTSIFFLWAVLFCGVAVSCKRETRLIDTATPIEQDNVSYAKDYYLEFLSSTGFSQENSNINQANTEMGYEFKATSNGEITSVSVKIPNVNPAVRVTIWDVDNATPLVTTTVNVTMANNIFEQTINTLPIVKNKKYAITMNTKDWYHRRHPNMNSTSYPKVIGPIEYTKVLHAVGAAQTLPNPTIPILNYLNGDIRFKFKIKD